MITAVINFLTNFIMPCDTDNVILKCYNQTSKGKYRKQYLSTYLDNCLMASFLVQPWMSQHQKG